MWGDMLPYALTSIDLKHFQRIINTVHCHATFVGLVGSGVTSQKVKDRIWQIPPFF